MTTDDDNDSDDEPVLSKIEIDKIEPLLSANQQQDQQIIDLVEHVKTEIVEDDSHFEHFEFLVESGNNQNEELNGEQLTDVKQELIDDEDEEEITEEVAIDEDHEDQSLTDEQLYKKYGITPLPNQNHASNPLKTGGANEKYSCQVCDKRFKLKKTWLFHLNGHATGLISSSGTRVPLAKRKARPDGPVMASRKVQIMSPKVASPKNGFTKSKCSFCQRQIKIINHTLGTRRKRVDLSDINQICRNVMVLGSQMRSMSDVEEVWTILHHQLKHCAYNKPAKYTCNYCGKGSICKTKMNVHLRDRNLCSNRDQQRESRVNQLYNLCEIAEQNRRLHFRCCKCEWTKTARSDEVLRQHLLIHVEEELRHPDHCQYFSYDGGTPCSKSRHDLALEYGFPHLASNTVSQKSIDLFLDVHLVQHVVEDIGKMMLENIAFFKRIHHYYQCTVCWVRFFKDFDSLKLHGIGHNLTKLVYRDIRKIDLAQEAAVLQRDSAYFEKVILRGNLFAHLRATPTTVVYTRETPTTTMPFFTPFAGVEEKSIHSCSSCGGEFLDQAQMDKHHCTLSVPLKQMQRKRPGPSKPSY